MQTHSHGRLFFMDFVPQSITSTISHHVDILHLESLLLTHHMHILVPQVIVQIILQF